MTRLTTALIIAVGVLLAAAALPAAAPDGLVTVRNPIDLARANETVVLPATELMTLLAVDDVRKVHVLDGEMEVLAQAVDLNDDGKFEQLIFQTDIGPNATRTFKLAAGAQLTPKVSDFKAYGRFVRERRDDFAWENDRIAHRMYGAALETWAQEPLTSSAVDVWTKRVRRLIINDWYMVDDYHHDNGTGGDFYSAGKSRGGGGSGLWIDGTLYPSANFRASRVLANGPIRVLFELTYQNWDAAGAKVSEVKRITLDAGQNLDRFESAYLVEGASRDLAVAAGIKKQPGSEIATSKETGIMRVWEPVQVKGNGNLGLGVIFDPSQTLTFTEGDGNYLVIAPLRPGRTVSYYAGFAWDRSGDVANAAEWDAYLSQFARRLKSPLEVTLGARPR
ncbi:MAG: DUF4861 family protein [Acidobacteria bacterium]|nr:DUF4861 family protein [Acidobacteriota bacterium]